MCSFNWLSVVLVWLELVGSVSMVISPGCLRGCSHSLSNSAASQAVSVQGNFMPASGVASSMSMTSSATTQVVPAASAAPALTTDSSCKSWVL